MPPEKQYNGNSHKKSLLRAGLAFFFTFLFHMWSFKAHSKTTSFIWEGRSAEGRGT